MVTWFAGLFYLPRLFIYHCEAAEATARIRFEIMERRLFIIMTIGAILTTILGLTLLGINHALLAQGWFNVKLLLLGALIVYHARCWRWIGLLSAGKIPPDTKWLRWFNEVPTLFLLGIIILAVVKPF